jgi:adenine phosphoribosyltransferase
MIGETVFLAIATTSIKAAGKPFLDWSPFAQASLKRVLAQEYGRMGKQLHAKLHNSRWSRAAPASNVWKQALSFGANRVWLGCIKRRTPHMEKLIAAIRNIPDFPTVGIQFKDIAPLLADGSCFRQAIDALKLRHAGNRIDMVAGIEARGFVFASALAYALGAGTCMVRKPGKLPGNVLSQTYDLEYGTDAIEIHADAFGPGQRILLVDDVLATGGTMAAAVQLIEANFDVEIVEIDFLLELGALNGRPRLGAHAIHALLNY